MVETPESRRHTAYDSTDQYWLIADDDMKATQSCKILLSKYCQVSEGQLAQFGRHRIGEIRSSNRQRSYVTGERRLISRLTGAPQVHILGSAAIRGINFLNVVTFHSWRIVDISVRIRRPKNGIPSTVPLASPGNNRITIAPRTAPTAAAPNLIILDSAISID